MELYPKTTALDLPFKQKLLESIKIWGLCFVGFICSALFMSFTNLVLKSAFHFDLAKTNQFSQILNGPPIKYILIPFIGPLLEECIFRLWQDYKIKHILIAGTVFLTLLVFKITGFNQQPIKYIYEGVLAFLAVIFILKKDRTAQTLHVTPKTRKCLYYLAAILFGLMHIGNFSPIHYQLLFIYPVFVLPQLIMGFGFGYTRIKYGFFFGFLLHCITNMIPLLSTL